MAVTDVNKQQYDDFLENGGNVIFTIDSTDISPDGAFENFPLIKPCLYSGFELSPSTIIHAPQAAVDLYVHGDSWGKVITVVYRFGGKIIYKKLSNGRFQADCTIPIQA